MTLRICNQCHLHWATDLLVCDECNKANALALAADCPTCKATAEYDHSGRVTITHKPGCRALTEFAQKVDDIEDDGEDDDRRHRR